MPLSSIEEVSLAYGLDHYEVDGPYRVLLRYFLGREPDLRGLGRFAGSDVYEVGYRVDRVGQPLLFTWSVDGVRRDVVWLDPAERRVLEELVRKYGVNRAPYEGGSWHEHYAGIYLVGDPGLACVLTITMQTAYTLYKYGGDLGKHHANLAGLEEPLMWGATWFTEVQGGSDLGANTTTAVRGEDGVWRLTGYKYFASGAGIADLALVTARIPGSRPGAKGLSLFLVPRLNRRGEPNYAIRRLKWKSGTVAVPTGEVELIDSEAYLIGEADKGIYYTLESLMVSRLSNSMGALGVARKAYLEAYLYALRRKAFGRRLVDHSLVVRDLLEMEAELEATMAVTMKAITLFDRAWRDTPPYGEAYHYARLLTHIAKNMTAEMASRVTQTAMELFGGIGFLHEFPVERWHREALITPIWEGTSNIQALDMLEVMEKKGAHKALLQELDELARDSPDPSLAKAALDLAGEALRIASTPESAVFNAKDILRMLGSSTAILLLLDASSRIGDPAAAQVARIYYESRVLGKFRSPPAREVVSEILSLRGRLPSP